MVYFIFDNPADKSKMEFLSEYPTIHYKQMYPDHKLSGIFDMVKFVYQVVQKTKSRDSLIFWYDFMGILCWWICTLSFKRRDITILNILLKDKKSKKNKLAKFLYKRALKSNVKATVTSREYGSWLNNLLGIRRNYHLLHDIYYGDAKCASESRERYVFCGGRNGRDWNQYFEIAKTMPRTKFLAVLPVSTYEDLKSNIPQNVIIKTDISEKEFVDAICKSALVAMPLDTQAPAGLIAIFQAASYNKCVITSDTVTTREYINSENGVLCSDIESWVESIEFLLENSNEAEYKASKLNQFLNEKCSEAIYANTLYEIVKGE